MTTFRRWIAWLGASVAGLAFMCGWQASPQPRGATRLFEPSAIKSPSPDSGTIRQRTCEFDVLARIELNSRTPRDITLNLFDDAEFQASMQSLDRRGDESWTATGTLTNDDGQFVLAMEQGWIAGAVWTANRGTFVIQSTANADEISIRQINAAALGGCACTNTQAIREPGRSRQEGGETRHVASSSSACNQAIDVMIVYTARARQAVGTEGVIKALAQAAVGSANIANENSNVEARYRLVHVAEVDYAESNSLATDLTRLQVQGDGFLDDVAALRVQYGADLVTLLVDSFDTSCGIAFVMTSPSQSFQPNALSVIQQSCALGNLSYAHEISHNLGCQHDWNDPSPGAFPYSHGLRFAGNSGATWRTVMAGSSGTRIPYFSNPNIMFDGVPTGIAEGQPNPADNARTINNTAPIASAFVSAMQQDCNRNGVPDECDILSGASLDLNENGVPDECDAPRCTADELTTIKANDALSFDQFGGTVAIAADRIAVGAALDDDNGVETGSVYMFKSQDGAWVQEAKLHPLDFDPFQWFGRAVAISPDGTRVLVGAIRDAPAAISDVGAAYIFHFNGTTWEQEQKLPNPDPQQQDFMGWSVAWAGNERSGLVAIVGTPFDDEAAVNAGAIYLYEQTQSGWSAPIKLMAADAQFGDRLGNAVAGSMSGDRVIAGAPFANAGASHAGAAYVFVREDGIWKQHSKLVATNPLDEARLGWSVAIDGDFALAGAIYDSQFGERAGAAIVFDLTSGSEIQKLFAANAGPQRQFGAAVSLRGSQALIGSTLDVVAGATSGSAFIFRNNGSSWTQRARIAPRDAATFDNFGIAVAIDPLGNRAVAGASFDDHDGAIDAGSASVFSMAIDRPDCNGNGIADDCDIANAISLDQNHNGIPDECEPTCSGDVAGHDGVVNVSDLLAVINHWGSCPMTCPAFACMADTNGDCAVTVADLLTVILQWGRCN